MVNPDRNNVYIARIQRGCRQTLTRNAVTLINGFARFVDCSTVAVNGVHYRAEHILIAVGGQPKIPVLPGAELGIYSDDFFK